MSRDKYIILCVALNIPIAIGVLLGNDLGIIIVLLSVLLLFLYTAYLLIYKKSYNLLSGMTDELYESTRKIPEEKEYYESKAKKIGYVSIIISILLIFFIKFILM